MIIYQDLNFKNFNSLKINCKIKLFLEVENVNEIYLLKLIFLKLKIKYYIIGNASNILFKDEYVTCPVIYINNSFSECYKLKQHFLVSSGFLIKKLIINLAKNNYGDFESLFAIPGTLGGLTYMNASDNNVAISEFIEKVIVLDENNNLIILDNKQCQFSYRNSIFQNNKYTILYVLLKPIKRMENKILENIKLSLKYRINNQDFNKNTCGSLFRNNEKYKAYELIIKCQCQNIKINDAHLSIKHANFLINDNNAKANDIILLINMVKNKIYEKYKIILEEELKILN